LKLRCRISGHAPSEKQVENQGLRFSHCERCGAELILRDKHWHTIPNGLKVVWRHADSASKATIEEANKARAAQPAILPEIPIKPNPVLVSLTTKVEPAASGGRILVSDDDPMIRDLLEHRLRGRGYQVELAEDGKEALNKIRHRPPDAIILDAMMPYVDGFEVLRSLREDPVNSKIPVIMLTARKQQRDIVEALDLGANDFIVKPFIPEELLTRLSKLL
jgi:two-component system OmpR family response regulator